MPMRSGGSKAKRLEMKGISSLFVFDYGRRCWI
jgi:hypothetical protein